ncbi:MAG: glutamate--cysteine ligase [Gammaproteobacteria bacterium]|nr:glutamate--cysteine ligase [Gammaproteobacteria bacterium]
MGDEIKHTHFSDEAFEEFRNRVDLETALLQQWVSDGLLTCEAPSAGAELEAWLVDRVGAPTANNVNFLEALDHELVVPELAKFNVEMNTQPLSIGPGFLETMHDNMWSLWQQCEETAVAMDNHLVMIGILPTVQQTDLRLAYLSEMKRYRALDEQIFRMRNGDPLFLDIEGHHHLSVYHHDVMLEAAATSFQAHYKVDINNAVRAYNASRVLSGPIVALAANSPYLFGHCLWDETRIPLFEQAVSVGGSDYSKRVTFGLRHAQQSIMECFEANRRRYPTLLPELMDTPPEKLAHLRMHNGTVWRWNRPLVGFEEDGTPHIRIEHRVIPAGPTMQDVLANAAFYFGALTALLDEPTPIEDEIRNRDAAKNFYECAKHGLRAQVTWRNQAVGDVRCLILDQLIPLARKGLLSIGYAAADADHWMEIIRGRVDSCQNGAWWQRHWVERYGRDFNCLVRAYQERQAQNIPVHRWPL